MKRERVKELLPVMQAFAEGKPIQYKAIDTGRWCDWDYSLNSHCSFSEDIEYRIKPEEEKCEKCINSDQVMKFEEENAQLKEANGQATEILQSFLKLKLIPCASGNSINMLQFENICKEAEQFLKDSEVEK